MTVSAVRPRLSLREPRLIFAMTGAGATPGGIAALNLNILHALVELVEEYGVRLSVLSFLEQDSDRPPFLPSSIPFRGFRGNKIDYSSALVGAAVRRPVVFFDHVSLSLPVLPLVAAGLIRSVLLAHGSEAWRRLRRLSKWSFRCASLCLANSHFTLARMKERIPVFHGRACPLGLSPVFPLNDEIPGPPADSLTLVAADGCQRILQGRVLLLVGRLHPAERKKGHYPLLRILPALQQEFPEVQMVFAGPGEDGAHLQALARETSVARSVFVTGYVSPQTLQRLYRSCYAFVMPSRQEGFGLVYLEAMNFGKPCVGCFEDGAEEIIVQGETGLLVRDPQDPGELLEVIRSLLQSPEKAASMGERGFERLHRHFTSRHVQERIQENLLEVLP